MARLRDKGLLKRGARSKDGRRVEVALTAAGRKLLSRVDGAAGQSKLVAALESLPAAHRKALSDGLALWVDALGMVDAQSR